jgi:putative Mg2+ transporter-C (MgtC) family protein
MLEGFYSGFEITFIINLIFSLIAGLVIGAEREYRGKDAGIRTQCLVIAGAMMFTMLSLKMDPGSPARIAAQIVTGIGFLGAGIILKSREGRITNLTTAASIWFSASVGIAIGFGWYIITILAVLYDLIVSRIPHVDYKPEGKIRHRD